MRNGLPWIVGLLVASTLPAQRWVSDSGLPPRRDHAAAFDSSRGEILVFGGRADTINAPGPGYGDTFVYGAGGWTQRFPADNPAPRWRHAMAYDQARGRIVLFGGMGPMTGPAFDDTWEFDGTDWHEVSTATHPTNSAGSMAYDGARGRCILLAASSPGPLETWEYDGISWAPGAVLPAVNAPGRVALTHVPGRNRTVAVLSDGSNQVAWNETWEYDGTSWTQVQTPQSPPPRTVSSIASDAQGLVWLFGGAPSHGTFLDDTWFYDGATWTQASPANSPPPTAGATLTWDAGRQRTVLVAGHGSWEFDGNDWAETVRSISLPSRAGAAFAFDAARDRIVMIGGWRYDGSGHSDEHWEWDGQAWHQVQAAVMPPVLQAPWNITYDHRRGRVVLHEDFPTGDQTWEFDGQSWARIQTPHEPFFDVAALMYDPARGECVAFSSGTTGSGSSSRNWAFTWRYDGNDWDQLPTILSPSLRDRPAMAYDAARDTIVLYGGAAGSSGSSALSDTWEYSLGVGWQRLNPQIRPRPGGGFMVFDARRGRPVLGQWGSPSLVEFDGTLWHALPAKGLEDQRRGYAMPILYNSVRQRIVTVSLWGTVWHLESLAASHWTRYGSGCPDGPTLDAAPSSVPGLGSTFVLDIVGLAPQPGALWLAFGFDLVSYAGTALPMRLDGLGLPDCRLWLAPTHGALVLHSGGAVQHTLAIPNVPALAGVHFAAQGLVLDPAAPFAIGTVTNAGIATVF